MLCESSWIQAQLQAQLLKRFHLTEGGYRKRFKTGKLEPGETPAQFVVELDTPYYISISRDEGTEITSI